MFLIFYNARHSEWAKTKNVTAVSTDTSANTHTNTIGALENRFDAGKKANAKPCVGNSIVFVYFGNGLNTG